MKLLLTILTLLLLTTHVAIAQLPPGRDFVTILVYLDSRCDGFYGQNDIPLRNITVTLDDGTSGFTTRTNSLGFARIQGFDVTSIATLTAKVELPATFKGFDVVPCKTSPTVVNLTPDDFAGTIIKFKYLQFGASTKAPQ